MPSTFPFPIQNKKLKQFTRIRGTVGSFARNSAGNSMAKNPPAQTICTPCLAAEITTIFSRPFIMWLKRRSGDSARVLMMKPDKGERIDLNVESFNYFLKSNAITFACPAMSCCILFVDWRSPFMAAYRRYMIKTPGPKAVPLIRIFYYGFVNSHLKIRENRRTISPGLNRWT